MLSLKVKQEVYTFCSFFILSLLETQNGRPRGNHPASLLCVWCLGVGQKTRMSQSEAEEPEEAGHATRSRRIHKKQLSQGQHLFPSLSPSLIPSFLLSFFPSFLPSFLSLSFSFFVSVFISSYIISLLRWLLPYFLCCFLSQRKETSTQRDQEISKSEPQSQSPCLCDITSSSCSGSSTHGSSPPPPPPLLLLSPRMVVGGRSSTWRTGSRRHCSEP